MRDFVVYTAITGDYDNLKNVPSLWRDEAEFVAFLEIPSATTGWKIGPICNQFADPCRNAKIHKILAHKYFPKAKYSLWVDGSVQIDSKLPLSFWANQYLDQHDLAVFRHRCRNCIYVEAAHCLSCGVDSPEVISRQINQYRREGYPAENGLAECTVLFRRHTAQMEQFNEAWYREIAAHSRRDQLSFNYVAHTLEFKYAHLPGSMAENPHFKWLSHTTRGAKVQASN